MKHMYFAIFNPTANYLYGRYSFAPDLFPSRVSATDEMSRADSDGYSARYEVVPVELKICTPSRRANSATKKKEFKMSASKKVVKKPAGEVPWPAKKAKVKPKAKGKK